jgi:hypothetical protein
MVDHPVATSEVRRIASLDLADAGETMAVAPERWARVLMGLGFQRLTGIAVTAWEAGRLELTAEQADDLLERHRGAMSVALDLERIALRVSAILAEADVRVVVLKGSAIAHTCYPDPTMRPFGDLDLLVSSADWGRADEALRSHGFDRELPEPRPDFERRFAKGITYTGADGYQVDLHRTLARGPFGLWLDPDELLAAAEPFELAGRRLERLDRAGLLVNAALHASLGATPPLLLPLRDIVQVARDPGVDWDRLARWVAAWRLSAPVGFAFANVPRELGLELPAAAAAIAAIPSRRSDRRLIEAYTKRRREGAVGIATVRGIPGIRAKAAYVFALLVPDRAFRQAWSRSHGGSLYRSRRTSLVRIAGRIRRSIRKSKPLSMEGANTFHDR